MRVDEGQQFKKRNLPPEINLKTETEAKKRKKAPPRPPSNSSPEKASSVPPATTPVAPKMSSQEKHKDSFLVLPSKTMASHVKNRAFLVKNIKTGKDFGKPCKGTDNGT